MRKHIIPIFIAMFCAACAPKPWDIQASRYDAQKNCWHHHEVVGQTTAKACNTKLYHSRDEKGVLWRHGGCYPKTFTPAKDIPKASQSAPACPVSKK